MGIIEEICDAKCACKSFCAADCARQYITWFIAGASLTVYLRGYIYIATVIGIY